MAKSPDKTPPHDDELERATLGSLLFDKEAYAAVVRNNLKPEDFYSRAHQRIFIAIGDLDARGLRPDIQTVIQELKHKGKLDESGGAAYISSLTSIIPSGANIDYYIESVLDLSLRRSLLYVASGIGVKAYDESRKSPEILEEVEKDVFELRDKRQALSYNRINEVMFRTIDKINDAYLTKKVITGIPTGFSKLDEMTSGFQESDFIIIGARPSVGKTALALNMASNIAINNNIPTAFFSLEMSDVALAHRLISTEAMIDSNKLRSGFFGNSEFRKILDVSGKISDAPFYIVDMPNMKMTDIRSQARRLCAQENIKIIFIDYLGLISHDNKNMPRYDLVSDISRSLKSLARELKIPVVVLAQLNRENERQGHQPTLANLRDSGSIEQDADLVIFLHKKQIKKSKKDETDDEPLPHSGNYTTEMIVAKQRNGPIGIIDIELLPKYLKFIPIEKEHKTQLN